jgi:hypothetical protein
MTPQEAIASGEFTASEIAVIKWQYNLYGSFYTSLFEAFGHADRENIERLQKGFPDEVIGFRTWRGDFGSSLGDELASKIDEAIGL